MNDDGARLLRAATSAPSISRCQFPDKYTDGRSAESREPHWQRNNLSLTWQDATILAGVLDKELPALGQSTVEVKRIGVGHRGVRRSPQSIGRGTSRRLQPPWSASVALTLSCVMALAASLSNLSGGRQERERSRRSNDTSRLPIGAPRSLVISHRPSRDDSSPCIPPVARHPIVTPLRSKWRGASMWVPLWVPSSTATPRTRARHGWPRVRQQNPDLDTDPPRKSPSSHPVASSDQSTHPPVCSYRSLVLNRARRRTLRQL